MSTSNTPFRFRSTSLAIALSAAMLAPAAMRAAETATEPPQIFLPPSIIVDAIKYEPPPACPAVQPEAFSFDALLWEQVFWRRLFARE